MVVQEGYAENSQVALVVRVVAEAGCGKHVESEEAEAKKKKKKRIGLVEVEVEVVWVWEEI